MSKLIISKIFGLAFEYVQKHGRKYLEKNYEFNKLLKDLGLQLEPKDNYNSIYVRTLLILEEKKDFKIFLKLFQEDEVVQSFEKADRKGDREIFVRELNAQLHINPKFLNLKNYNEIPSLVISEFLVMFNKCREDTWNPNEVKTFKEIQSIKDDSRLNYEQGKEILSDVKDIKIYLADRNQDVNIEKLKKSYKARLEQIFKNIKNGNIDAGNIELIELKNEIWSDIPDYELKNSILKKIAYCYLEKKVFSSSAEHYEEALKIKNDPGTLSTLALIYHQLSDEINLKRVITELEKINPEKAEITKIRFGISSKHPDVYYACFVNEEIKDEDTLLALIQYFGQSKEYKKAFEIGDSLIQLFNKIEYKEFTSSFGIQHLQFKGVHMGLGYIDETNREIFRKGLKYITECCEYYKGKEIEKYKIDVFANKSIYETWNKNFELATEFIEYAISLDEKNYSLIKIQGVIYTRKNNYEKAIKCFEKIPTPVPEDLEDLPLLKSVCYLILGDNDKAFNELESTFAKIRDINIKQRTTEQLINLCFLAGDIDKAKRIFEANYIILPSEYEKLVRAKILNIEGKVNEGLIILDELKGEFIKSTEFSPIVPDLGNEFLRIKEHNSAIELYEAFANYSEDTFFVRALFELYFNNQQFDKAIEICEAQRKPRIHEFYTQYEIAIYLDYRDYEMVVELSEQYLLSFPENVPVRLNLIYSELKLGNASKAKDHLKYPFKIETFNERDSSNLCDLHIKLNQFEDALDFTYKLLATKQNAFYSNLFIKVSIWCDDYLASLKNSISNKNHSIVFTQGEDQKVITLVEKNKHDCFTYFSEVPCDDRKYHKLLNCKIGQTVIIDEDEKVEIKNVLHKYVYAFQKEFQNANSIYKSDSFIKTFDASPLKQGIVPDELREVIESAKKAQSKFDNFFKMYNQGRIPLISLSEAFNRPLIEIWFDTINSKSKMISVCHGIGDEMEYNLKIIEDHKKELLLDITSLLLIYELDVIHIINKYFNTYVIQDVIDYLDNYLSLNAIVKNSRTNKIENLLVWTRANIEIYPPNIFIKIDKNAIAKYSEIIGQATSKNIVLAADADLLYLCDDIALRNLYTSEFKKPALWTQNLIQYLHNIKLIADEVYFELTSRLVERNIKHTHITGQLILYYFKKTNYQITNSSLKFLKVFRGDYSDNSAFTVAYSFLFGLWRSETEIDIKQKITFEVLLHLATYRVFVDVENSIKKILFILFDNSTEILEQWLKVKQYLGIN
jgi:tetratricopeptide (TPR) repeat protein